MAESPHPPAGAPSWLPGPRIVTVPGRGEVFCRVHERTGTSRPTLLLLHGWTATADVQFAPIYRSLMEHYSFVAVDHRGHGRGIRDAEPFRLEDAADDAAGVLHVLGTGPVIAVGYSMGGPIAIHFADRHPDLARGLVLEATGLTFSSTVLDRVVWWFLSLMETMLRSRIGNQWARRRLEHLSVASPEVRPLVPWLAAEIDRGNPRALTQAGRALRHFDGEPIASRLRLPVSVVLTVHDHSVRPGVQRRMAETLRARVVELDGGHFCSLQHPDRLAAATLEATAQVERALAPAPLRTSESAARPA